MPFIKITIVLLPNETVVTLLRYIIKVMNSRKSQVLFYLSRSLGLFTCLLFYLGFAFPVLKDSKGITFTLSSVFRGEAGEEVLLIFAFLLLFFLVMFVFSIAGFLRKSNDRASLISYSLSLISLALYASSGTWYYITVLGSAIFSYLVLTVSVFLEENQGKKIFSVSLLFATLFLFLLIFFLGKANLSLT